MRLPLQQAAVVLDRYIIGDVKIRALADPDFAKVNVLACRGPGATVLVVIHGDYQRVDVHGREHRKDRGGAIGKLHSAICNRIATKHHRAAAEFAGERYLDADGDCG